MNHSFVSLIVAGVAVSSGSYALTSAQPVHQTTAVEILVNGSVQRSYLHEGRVYVEALKGREYAIRLRNPYPVRAAVALSVDGLNTIDAVHSSAAEARKWVLGPYETVTISGWQTSRTEARRFEFTTEARSYAQALGKAENLGVISAVFFKERVPKILRDSGNDASARFDSEPTSPAAGPGVADSASLKRLAEEEYAATGMGRRTHHAVTQVWLDLEEIPAHSVNIRYEYRPQLVRLGLLPSFDNADPLQRRERARGFEPGFSPEPPRR